KLGGYLPSPEIEEPGQLVGTTGGQGRPIGAEGHGVNPTCGSRQRRAGRNGVRRAGDVPQVDAVLGAGSGGKAPAVTAGREREDLTMSMEGAEGHGSARISYIPEAYCGITASGGQRTAAGCEGNR